VPEDPPKILVNFWAVNAAWVEVGDVLVQALVNNKVENKIIVNRCFICFVLKAEF
jgi:hypothetical protein